MKLKILLSFIILALFSIIISAQNPITRDVFAAVPAPLVYDNTVYLPNCFTTHPGIVDFKGKSYFMTHNGNLSTGGSYRRSICIDYMYYNEDGTIQKVIQTEEGVKAVQ